MKKWKTKTKTKTVVDGGNKNDNDNDDMNEKSSLSSSSYSSCVLTPLAGDVGSLDFWYGVRDELVSLCVFLFGLLSWGRGESGGWIELRVKKGWKKS